MAISSYCIIAKTFALCHNSEDVVKHDKETRYLQDISEVRHTACIPSWRRQNLNVSCVLLCSEHPMMSSASHPLPLPGMPSDREICSAVQSKALWNCTEFAAQTNSKLDPAGPKDLDLPGQNETLKLQVYEYRLFLLWSLKYTFGITTEGLARDICQKRPPSSAERMDRLTLTAMVIRIRYVKHKSCSGSLGPESHLVRRVTWSSR